MRCYVDSKEEQEFILNKTFFRKKFLFLRSSIINRAEKDCIIYKKVLNLLQGREYNSLFCYVSFNGEVSTIDLLKGLQNTKQIYTPFTHDGKMLLSRYDGSLPLHLDKFANIIGQEKGQDISADITIVPMLAFNNNLKRLGYGGGYYDRYLSSHTTLSVGLAYDEQFLDKDIFNGYDKSLDLIVTPTKILGEK